MTSRRCTGAILAGGRAVRMGGKPKGLELVGGRRILDRVADADPLVARYGNSVAPADTAEALQP